MLTPTAPLHFRATARPTALEGDATLVKSVFDLDYGANPLELWLQNGSALSAMVTLTPGPCPGSLQPPLVSADYRAEERCTDAFGRITIEGNPSVVERLLGTLRVTGYRPARGPYSA